MFLAFMHGIATQYKCNMVCTCDNSVETNSSNNTKIHALCYKRGNPLHCYGEAGGFWRKNIRTSTKKIKLNTQNVPEIFPIWSILTLSFSPAFSLKIFDNINLFKKYFYPHNVARPHPPLNLMGHP